LKEGIDNPNPPRVLLAMEDEDNLQINPEIRQISKIIHQEEKYLTNHSSTSEAISSPSTSA
jgi:hypothetical protein